MISPWDLNLRHLRAFACTVEKGTLVAAARAVHISQPALTQAMSRLESIVGLGLFVRQHNGMEPTAAAQLFYPRVVKALSLVPHQRATHVQLRAFWALARGGTYAEASQATGLTPASLHRAVADLEHALAQALVRRAGRRLQLTPDGAAFARSIKLFHSEVSAGLAELQTLRGEDIGRVAVGAMPLCRARVLPSAIVAFRKTHVDFDVVIAEGSFAELVEPLRDGELDFLVGALREPPPGRDLVQEPLFVDRPVVLARARHPLANRRRAPSLRELAAFDWCLPQRGVPLRDRWEELFSAAGLTPPPVRVAIGSGIAIRHILMNTDALTLLSPDQAALELDTGRLAIIARTPIARTIGLTRRADWRPTQGQHQFIATLRAQC